MSYRLGVDLGTAYSSAAVGSQGKARMVALGNRSAVLPSVVFVREGGAVLVGEAADRRGMAEPARVAREFKRRFGDPVPFDLGGTELRAEQLMAIMFQAIFEATVAKEGERPDLIALTHPATWGQHKRTALRQAMADLDLDLPPVMLVTEPEAAAIYYAETEHLAVGEVVAVYDLGGGTFDAALLRRTEAGFDLMGPPEGIDRLGGVDFDAAVYAHVNRFLDGALDNLDLNNPTVTAGLSRLRADCVEAKEALSADTDVTIAVLLPNLRTELRMTRGELESMIRPALGDTIGALRRAMRSAHVVASDVRVVLLVGGSSRIPLVAQMVGAEVGRPVAVDVHPKHAVALGAALVADAAHQRSPEGGPTPEVGTVAAGGSAADAAADLPPAPTPAPGPVPTLLAAPEIPRVGSSVTPTPPAAAAAARGWVPPVPDASGSGPVGRGGPTARVESTSNRREDPAATPVPAARGRSRLILVGALIALVALVAAVGVALSGGGTRGSDATTAAVSSGSTSPKPGSTGPVEARTETTPRVRNSAIPTPTEATSATVTLPTSTTLAPECVDRPFPFVCAMAVGVDAAGYLIIPFSTFGYTADTAARHIHFFFPAYPEIALDVTNAGNGGPNSQGHWIVWDDPNPFGGPTAYKLSDARSINATEICVLVADSSHAVTPGTGNCLALPG